MLSWSATSHGLFRPPLELVISLPKRKSNIGKVKATLATFSNSDHEVRANELRKTVGLVEASADHCSPFQPHVTEGYAYYKHNVASVAHTKWAMQVCFIKANLSLGWTCGVSPQNKETCGGDKGAIYSSNKSVIWVAKRGYSYAWANLVIGKFLI